MRLRQMTLVVFTMTFSYAVHAEWFKEEQAIMGTSVSVELWDTNESHAQQCIQQVMNFMRHVDDEMSPFKPESELSLLNREAAKHPVKVSSELFDVIKTSVHFSELSNGVFDVTFSSVGYRYDYRNGVHPSDAQITKDLDKIDYHLLKLDEKNLTIHYGKPGVRVDLGGIAKGWAVDRSIEKLQACGIQQAIVSAGGDSRIIGDRQGRPWMIGIKDPRNPTASAVVIPLSDTAISTSGDYERYFIEKGKRYHHILNPRTGKPADACRSVSILAPTATMTDGLTKPVFILGPEKGLALIEKLKGVDAIVIDKDGKLHYSSGLMPPTSLPAMSPTSSSAQ